MVVPGPGGLVIACQDVEALDAFQRLLTTLANSNATRGPDMTVFYLRYAKASVAGETLDQIFGGGSGAGSAIGPGMDEFSRTVPGDTAGGVIDSLQGNRPIPTGPVQITPDPRLNALFVRARAADLDTIQEILDVLDQKASPAGVCADARPRIIPVRHSSAEEVAEVVRQVYQDRLTGGTGNAAAAAPFGGFGPPMGGFGGFAGGPPFFPMIRGIGQAMGGGSARARAEEPQKMSVGVDARTNSLVVYAPETLFEEVKRFVEAMDDGARRSSQVIRVVTLDHSSPLAMQRALGALLGPSVQMGNVSSGGSGPRAGATAAGQEGLPGQAPAEGGPSAAAGAPASGGTSLAAPPTPIAAGYSGGSSRGRLQTGTDRSSPASGIMP
jgi:hypothetical protein